MHPFIVSFCLIFAIVTGVGANTAIQIVQPDAHHSQLLINEDSIKALEAITDEVAVIGVVGPFHSGKSFLLNQLMGKTSGFTIGPTVEPTTRGLWMWAEPYKYVTKSGKSVSVLFLDTEGFYASNDAKIFAVSTLLSSYLVFNSVKVIDQSSIEYLELLARRTQLFGIKAEFANKDSVYKNFINFPPLDLAGQTCTEWLNTFLDGYKRDGGQKSALSGIFPEISCSTVFLPHSELESLRHLDQVPPEQFTKKYIEDMKSLREKIFADVADLKSAGNMKSFMTGPGIASLLRILVTYANTGDFPEIPSIWSGFLSLQRETSIKYCVSQYKSEVRKGNEVILPEEEFEKLHKKSSEAASKLFQQLLFGLPEVYTPGVKLLENEIQSVYQVYKGDNLKRIEGDVKKEHDKKIKEYENALTKIALPLSSGEFSKKNQQLSSQTLEQFAVAVQKFSTSSYVKESKEEIKNTMLRIFATYQIKNKELLEARLDSALKETASVYTFEMDPDLSSSMPVTTSSFNLIHKKSEAKAMSTFAASAAVAKEEMTYKVYESQAKASIEGLYKVYVKSNVEKLQQLCDKVSQSAIKIFRDGSGTVYGLLPLEDGELKYHLDPLVKSSLSHYSHKLANFTDTPTYDDLKTKLQSTLNDMVRMVENTNIEQMRIACRTALENSRKILIPVASQYWLTISYRHYAYKIVDGQIGNSIKSPTTRNQVIEDFLAKDLKDAFDEVAFWTKILGFIVVFMLGFTMYVVWQVKAEQVAQINKKRR